MNSSINLNLEAVGKIATNTRVQHNERISELEEQVKRLTLAHNQIKEYISKEVLTKINILLSEGNEIKRETDRYVNNRNKKELLIELYQDKDSIMNDWARDIVKSVHNNATWSQKQFEVLDQIIISNYPKGDERWN